MLSSANYLISRIRWRREKGTREGEEDSGEQRGVRKKDRADCLKHRVCMHECVCLRVYACVCMCVSMYVCVWIRMQGCLATPTTQPPSSLLPTAFLQCETLECVCEGCA